MKLCRVTASVGVAAMLLETATAFTVGSNSMRLGGTSLPISSRRTSSLRHKSSCCSMKLSGLEQQQQEENEEGHQCTAGRADGDFAPMQERFEAAAAARSRSQLPFLSTGAAGATALSLAVLTTASPAMAETPDWVIPTRVVIDPLLLLFEFAFVCRIVLSWYPAADLNKLPYNIVAWPTEPILKPTRAVVPPAFGVDISPIVWVFLLSLAREVLVGQQGLLTYILVDKA